MDRFSWNHIYRCSAQPHNYIIDSFCLVYLAEPNVYVSAYACHVCAPHVYLMCQSRNSFRNFSLNGFFSVVLKYAVSFMMKMCEIFFPLHLVISAITCHWHDFIIFDGETTHFHTRERRSDSTFPQQWNIKFNQNQTSSDLRQYFSILAEFTF